MENYCFSFMGLLDGGLRREVIARLRTDSLIQKESSYYLKKQTEKKNRGNSHEIPILEISAFIFKVWLNERKSLIKEDDSIVSLWITTELKPARPAKMVEKMKDILKEFNKMFTIT